MSKNRETIIRRIWDDPARVFGHDEKRGHNAARKEIPALKIALLLSPNGRNITIVGQSGANCGGSYSASVFDYLQDYVFNTPNFRETLEQAANAYGETLEYTPEERRRYGMQRMAQELAPVMVESLRNNPNGEAAQYLTRRGLPMDSGDFGELTPETIEKAKAHLRGKGIDYTAADLDFLGLTEYRANKGYNVVIFHKEGGVVQGFIYRNTRDVEGKDRYRASNELKRGSFSPNPIKPHRNGYKRAYITEGEIDALRLSYAGFENVLAIGGAQNKERFCNYLRYCAVDEAVIVPDVEQDSKNPAKRDYKKIDALANIIKSAGILCSVSELPKPDGVDKIDVDAYAQRYGVEILRDEIIAKTETYAKHRIKRVEAEISAFAGTGHDLRQFARKEFLSVYNEEKTYFDKRDISDVVANSEIFAGVGITPEYVEHREKHERQERHQSELKALFIEASQSESVEAEQIADISARLRALQAYAESGPVTELYRNIDEEIKAAALTPPPLRTRWEVGHVVGGIYEKEEFISFAPADITVFAAPTGHGKSTILTQAAINILKEHPQKYVIYVATEETPAFVLLRIINNCLDIDTTTGGTDDGATFKAKARKATIKAILAGTPPPDDLRIILPDQMQQAAGDLFPSEELKARNNKRLKHYAELTRKVVEQVDSLKKSILPRFIRVNVGTDADAVISRIERLNEEITKRGGEVAAVFLDYIQQMTTTGKYYSRTDEMKYICNELKGTAVKIGVPMVVAAQLNRDATKAGIDEISLSNIGEASDIEKVANAVYIIWNTSKTAQQLGRYADTTDGILSRNDSSEIIAKPANIGIRANRILSRGNIIQATTPKEKEKQMRKLKAGYYYVEHFKSRETAGGAWALLKFDGESGRVDDTDGKAMAE